MDTKKTLLELHFAKNLQYKITTIFILFSYLIAVLIAFLSGQLNIKNTFDVAVVGIISFLFSNILILLWMNFDFHMDTILNKLKILGNEIKNSP